MTETYDKLNHWYGWNGGECPVHPDTRVQTSGAWGLGSEHPAHCISWHNSGLAAFRIIKLHVEPKVIWVNEHDIKAFVYSTKSSAETNARQNATRIAVRYVEQPL